MLTTTLSCYVTLPARFRPWICLLPFKEDPQAHSHSLPPPSLASMGQARGNLLGEHSPLGTSWETLDKQLSQQTSQNWNKETKIY